MFKMSFCYVFFTVCVFLRTLVSLQREKQALKNAYTFCTARSSAECKTDLLLKQVAMLLPPNTVEL